MIRLACFKAIEVRWPAKSRSMRVYALSWQESRSYYIRLEVVVWSLSILAGTGLDGFKEI
jgi:hypothetical protein